MKKTLLSMAAALAVIGSAYAAPSVEDRKAFCDEHPDKYVWVAKDEFCSPINPCESNNETIKKAYCSSFELYNFGKKRDLVIDRYVEKVLNTKVSDIKEVSDCNFGVKTSDGGYLLIKCRYNFKNEGYFSSVFDTAIASEVPDEFAVTFSIADAMQIYDFMNGDTGFDVFSRRIREEHSYLSWLNPVKCKNIADFASLLSGTLITYSEVDGRQCELKW